MINSGMRKSSQFFHHGRPGVLNLFPVKNPRVIKQSTQIPSKLQQRQIRQNLHGDFNWHTFSSGIGC